jgi:hypothetical protein
LVWAKRLFGFRGGIAAVAHRSTEPIDLVAAPPSAELARC